MLPIEFFKPCGRWRLRCVQAMRVLGAGQRKDDILFVRRHPRIKDKWTLALFSLTSQDFAGNKARLAGRTGLE